MLKHQVRFRKSWAFGGAALSVLAFAYGAQAQAPAAATASANGNAGGALAEVVVTAEKRESTIQRTPVAVTAVNNEQLDREGVTQLANLEKVVPDVKLTRQGPGMTVSIRGVYSTDNSPTSEAANAVHVNGSYLAKTNGLQGFLYDVERVEVAKGPQGTLYGRNANGGTINIITNKPVLGEKAGSAEIEYGSHNLLRGDASLNVPMSDTMAMRLALHTYSHEGFLKSGLDDADEQAARLSFRWKPSERDSFWIVGDFGKIHNKGDGVSNVVAKQPGTNFYVPSNPRDDTFYDTDTASGRAEVFRRDSENRGITAQNDYNFDFATWTTELSYRKFDSQAINQNNLGQGASITIPSGTFPQAARNYNPQHFESYSVESRLTSASTTPLAYVIGIYGFQDVDSGTMIGYGGLRATTPSIQIANPYEKAQSGAIFGQLTYTPGGLDDKLHVIVGGRYTGDHKNADGIFTQFGTGPYSAGPSNFEKSWNAFTYKGGLSYDITSRNLLYGSMSTGYKAGGFGYGPGTSASQGPVYKPEKITAYELGSKNRFFDNTLQVNIEAFYYKYRDYQTNLTLRGPGSPLPVLTVTSAGEATYKGAAIDAEYLLTRDDTFKANFSIVNAKYGTFLIAPPAGFALLGSGDLSNTHIPGVAKWTGTTSYLHTFNVWDGKLDAEFFASLRGPIDFTSPTPDGAYGVVLIRDKSRGILNLSLRYSPSNWPWAVTAYVHNLTNNTEPVGMAYSTTTHLTTAFFADPRIFGMIFSAKF